MILIYQNKRKPPEVFISYCWQNSKQAEAKNTVIKNRKSLGAVDPRDIKDFLMEKKLSCWLDIERIGTVSILIIINVGYTKTIGSLGILIIMKVGYIESLGTVSILIIIKLEYREYMHHEYPK